MRINNLEIKNFYHIENVILDISQDDNVIAIICNKEPNFAKTDFMYAMEQLFNGDMSMRSGVIKCECEKNSKKYFVELLAEKRNEKRVINGVEISGKTIIRKESCLCEESVNGRVKWFCGLNYREWLYPTPFWDYGVFKGESMFDEFMTGIEDGSLFEPTLNEEKEVIMKSVEKSLSALSSVKIGGKEIGIDDDGRLCVKNEGYINTSTQELSKENKMLVNFLFWLETLNIIKRVCEDTNRLLGFPIFIENFFEKLEDCTKMDLVFNNIRKTGRQAFIILNEHNAQLEAYCDKVFKIDIN